MNEVLEKFLRQVTEDDYPDDQPTDRPTIARAPIVGGVMVAVATALVGIIIVAAAVTFRSTSEVRTGTQEALAERARDLSAQVRSLEDQVASGTDAVEELRRDLAVDDEDSARDVELQLLAAEGGVAALSGPGLIVTIDDAPDAAAGSLNRVLDRDLQDIVNSLWQMGAEGIAVNDERLTQTSAIRGAGEAILVNYQPLNRPYVVAAVGTSSAGTDGSDLEALLEILSRDYGLVSSITVGDVALGPGEAHDSRFARSTTDSTVSEGAASS